MSRVLLFSDLHVAAHKRNIERLHDCLKTLEWVFTSAQDQQINDIIFAGDLFQDRQKIDVMTYHLTFNILSKYCNNDLRLWLLLGNHDLWYYDRWDISSVTPLGAISGIQVIDKPCTIDFSGYPIDFLPYNKAPIQYLEELRKGKKRKGNKVLIGHMAVDGAQLNALHNTRADEIVEHDGEMVRVTPDVFDGWDKVWLGHYHGQQQVTPWIEYIGSPLQLNFGEAFQHKHLVVYDLSNGTTEYIRNKFSPQHFIIPESDVDKYDIENNFIRVQVPQSGVTDLIELKRDLQQLKPGSLEIIPEKAEDQSHVVQNAKALIVDHDKMVEEYVKQVIASLGPEYDENTLIEIGKMICQTTT